MCELGKLLQNKMHSDQDLYFVVQEEHRGRHAKQVCITADVIERMVRKRQFKMSSIRVELSSQLSTTEILLHFRTEDVYPISRFPRSLLQDQDSNLSLSSQSSIPLNRLLANLRVSERRDSTKCSN